MDCLRAYEAEENNLHSAVPSSVLSSCQGLALPFLLGRSPIILNDLSCLLSEDQGSMLLMIATSSHKLFVSFFSENIAYTNPCLRKLLNRNPYLRRPCSCSSFLTLIHIDILYFPVFSTMQGDFPC